MWSKKFLARAKKLGYRHILKGDISNDEEKKLVLNNNAYSDLLLAMNCVVAFDYVDEAVSKEFPEGDAALAWRNLMQKFQPSTTGSRVYYKNEFNNSKLHSDKDDPDEWISGLEKLRKLVKSTGSEISDKDFIIHILNDRIVDVAQRLRLDYRHALLDVLLALRGLDALLHQLCTLGCPEAVVLRARERSRKV